MMARLNPVQPCCSPRSEVIPQRGTTALRSSKPRSAQTAPVAEAIRLALLVIVALLVMVLVLRLSTMPVSLEDLATAALGTT